MPFRKHRVQIRKNGVHVRKPIFWLQKWSEEYLFWCDPVMTLRMVVVVVVIVVVVVAVADVVVVVVFVVVLVVVVVVAGVVVFVAAVAVVVVAAIFDRSFFAVIA